MKKLILLFCLVWQLDSLAQYNYQMYENTSQYVFTIPTFIKDYYDSTKIELVDRGAKYTVIGERDPQNLIILFGLWNDKTENFKIFNVKNLPLNTEKIDVSIKNRKLFILSKADFSKNCIGYFPKWKKGSWDWSSGLVILPVKIRNSPKASRTFSKDVTLGFSGGAKVRISNYNPTYLNLLVNVGISAITIDAISTNDKLNQSSERAAFTGAFGVVLENHAFQFGLFFGKDRLSANDQKETTWIYNRKQWVSLGLGYQLLSKSDKNKENNPAKN